MSNKKLSSLDAVTTVDDADEFYVARSGEQKKITGANLKAAAGNGGSSSFVYCRLSIPGATDSGADVNVQVSDVTGFSQVDGMAFTGPTTFAPGHHSTPFIQMYPATLPDGSTLQLNYMEFMVSNGAGTEKLRIEMDTPFDIQNGSGGSVRNKMPFANVAITEQIGSDLTLVSVNDATALPDVDVAQIESAAGGQFFQEVLATLIYTPPT